MIFQSEIKKLLFGEGNNVEHLRRLSETKLREEEKSAIAEFCDALNNESKDSIQSIVLYGSAARLDYRPGKSDINLLIVLDHIDVSVLKSILFSSLKR